LSVTNLVTTLEIARIDEEDEGETVEGEEAAEIVATTAETAVTMIGEIVVIDTDVAREAEARIAAARVRATAPTDLARQQDQRALTAKATTRSLERDETVAFVLRLNHFSNFREKKELRHFLFHFSFAYKKKRLKFYKSIKFTHSLIL